MINIQLDPVTVDGGTVTRDKVVTRFVKQPTSMTSGEVAHFSTSLGFGFGFGFGGFVPPHDESFRRRVEDDAEVADLRVRDRDCKPNVMVILVDDGGEVVGTLYREKPTPFLELGSDDRRTLPESRGRSTS